MDCLNRLKYEFIFKYKHIDKRLNINIQGPPLLSDIGLIIIDVI